MSPLNEKISKNSHNLLENKEIICKKWTLDKIRFKNIYKYPDIVQIFYKENLKL